MDPAVRGATFLVHVQGRCVPSDQTEVYVALPAEKGARVTCQDCRTFLRRGRRSRGAKVLLFPGVRRSKR